MSVFGVREITNGNEPLRVVVVPDDGVSYIEKITEYGVRFLVGQSSSTGERVKRVRGQLTVGGATGLVHNVGADQVNVENTFDHLWAFRYKPVEINGNWFNEYPLVFTKKERINDGESEWDYFWLCGTKIDDTYKAPEAFEKEDGTLREFIYASIYEGFRDENNKLRSIPGAQPTVNRSAANFLTDARLNDGLGTDSAYTIQDLLEINYLQHRWTVRLGTKHVQSKLVGATSLTYNTNNIHKTVGNQTESNQFVLINEHAELFVLNQTISGGSDYSSNSVIDYRQIIDIEIDTPVVGQTTFTFDGEPISSIPEDTVIASRAWKTGILDQVVASDGYTIANDGKYPIKIEGIENPFGNIYKNIAGIKVYGDDYYITKNMKDYNWSSNLDNYHKLAYKVPRTSGYAKEMGYDNLFPFAELPSEVGESASTYYADYFYQNYSEASYRTAIFGGHWYNGSIAGLWLWAVTYSLGRTDLNIGARLSYRP